MESSPKTITFQMPLTTTVYIHSGLKARGESIHSFVGNLNVTYEINECCDCGEIKYVTWGDDTIKTDVQDLVKAIAPHVWKEIEQAMAGNMQYQQSLAWENGDDENYDVKKNDFD